MDFIAVKHVFGRLISFLATGCFPNEKDSLEEMITEISLHLNQKPYFQ